MVTSLLYLNFNQPCLTTVESNHPLLTLCSYVLKGEPCSVIRAKPPTSQPKEKSQRPNLSKSLTLQ